uniref:Uncharacterized protein n=1 Tax=Mycena chlorophos TaxID=658473 RepID=A0ABQ0KWH0_MYCCL|nr:predicted protein [Mycena chlorophos]
MTPPASGFDIVAPHTLPSDAPLRGSPSPDSPPLSNGTTIVSWMRYAIVESTGGSIALIDGLPGAHCTSVSLLCGTAKRRIKPPAHYAPRLGRDPTWLPSPPTSTRR